MNKPTDSIKRDTRLQRGMTSYQTASRRLKYYPFEGEWAEAFGQPERSGIWIVWGDSGNGKSSFVMQLTKNLCRWERALYFSLEEGRSGTLVASMNRHKMHEAGRRIYYYDTTNFAEIKEIIRSHPHRRVIVIDSLQYLGIKMADYKAFKTEFGNRTIIFTSHANGEKPRTSLGESVMYDAMMKIQVKVFLATTKGRYMGKKRYYTVWDEGAKLYWGDNPMVIDGKLTVQPKRIEYENECEV